MAEQTIGIYPQKRYTFRTDASYRAQWNFLPHKRADVIAKQLTYLEFHEWLMNNIRHAAEHQPQHADWHPLGLSVAEGFYKTDVLLYASICEAALHAVLSSLYLANKAEADPAVKECFCRVEDRFRRITDHETSISFSATDIASGHLCVGFKSDKEIPGREVNFNSLIKAGEAISLYDSSFCGELDWLRDQRNTIHLAKQVERNNQRKGFDASDRARAKKTTEDLRAILQSFSSELASISAQASTRPN
jgi:hypothetical protein